MPEVKKILISVPETLLQEVDDLVSCDNLSRSRLIQRAVMLYIKEQKGETSGYDWGAHCSVFPG